MRGPSAHASLWTFTPVHRQKMKNVFGRFSKHTLTHARWSGSRRTLATTAAVRVLVESEVVVEVVVARVVSIGNATATTPLQRHRQTRQPSGAHPLEREQRCHRRRQMQSESSSSLWSLSGSSPPARWAGRACAWCPSSRTNNARGARSAPAASHRHRHHHHRQRHMRPRLRAAGEPECRSPRTRRSRASHRERVLRQLGKHRWRLCRCGVSNRRRWRRCGGSR